MTETARTAADLLAEIEAHCGSKIEPRRLRFSLMQAVQREMDKASALTASINAVLSGCETFDPSSQKVIFKGRTQS